MKNRFGRVVLICTLGIVVVATANPSATASSDENSDALLSTMQQELQRAQTDLGKLDPAPYFLSYSVHDDSAAVVLGTLGTLVSSFRAQRRSADVVMRIGTPLLDNTHETNRSSAISSATLPLEDNPDAIARGLWRLTYQEYRKASGAYRNVKTETQVRAR